MNNWTILHNTLMLARLSLCFLEDDNLPYRVRQLLPMNTEEEVERAEAFYRSEIGKAKEQGETVPMERLCQICDYDVLVEDLLSLAYLSFEHPELYDLFSYMGYTEGITLELIADLRAMEGKEGPEIWELKEAYTRAARILHPKEGKLFSRAVFAMDERIYLYLQGENCLEDRWEDLCTLYINEKEEQLLIHEKEARELSDIFWQGSNLIQIAGPKGVGKRYLVHHLSAKEEFPVLEVDGQVLSMLNEESRNGALWRLRREILLLESAVCIYNIRSNTKQEEEKQLWTDSLLTPLLESGYPIFLCTDASFDLITATDHYAAKLELEELSRKERIDLWEGYLSLYGVRNVDTSVLGAKFKLNGSQIRKAAERLFYRSQRQEITEEIISRECMAVLPSTSLANLKKEKATQTLEDLKLPKAQKDILQNICSHILYRHQVYDVWNMEERYAYGKTVSALFTGPPGTGKTMAAHVIANMLKLPLYTVDLSQVIDKYIGETQKRLEEIFVTAERSSSILFFDEADAVFGKRSEVNDSKDRYANAEVAYILQRMEKYNGIVIMASNFQKNIDEAFMRRIRYLVHFEMPNEEVRRELWKGCFTKDTPLDSIDFDFLAKTFEFSGGSIKNVSLNAAFLAAEEGEEIGMSHMIRSIKHEYLKQGKSVFAAEFAPYGIYL